MTEKLDEAGELTTPTRAGTGPLYARAVLALSVLISLFHIYANSLGRLDDLLLTSMHWGGFALLCTLL
ncbi:MAG: hypothetical protein KDG49_21860, partial [Geminicoccaceae bacterium]|nr:hypothetical protein [Geminicoccaceae bacterium]